MAEAPEKPPERAAPWPRLGTYKIRPGEDGHGPTVWFVPSDSTPGVFYRVTWGCDVPADGYGWKCTCPRGRVLSHDGEFFTDPPNTCRHVRKVAEAEKADGLPPRPTIPPAPGSVFVD